MFLLVVVLFGLIGDVIAPALLSPSAPAAGAELSGLFSVTGAVFTLWKALHCNITTFRDSDFEQFHGLLVIDEC